MKETVSSTTKEVVGSKTDRVEEGRKWKAGLLAKGYQETPDGLLPITEVKKAGFVLVDDNWMIPSEEYIADGNSDRKPGEKYTGATRQYLNWRRCRWDKAPPKSQPAKLLEPLEDNDDIKIEDIPF